MATGTSKTTTDPAKIKRWVEERGGHPATVKSTKEADEPGLLRIDFPGYSGQQSLTRISWDEFFQKFEEKQLAFLYQDETKDGAQSRFCKLVSRTGSATEQQSKPKARKAAAGGAKSGGKKHS
jgi:hypothetical protein